MILELCLQQLILRSFEYWENGDFCSSQKYTVCWPDSWHACRKGTMEVGWREYVFLILDLHLWLLSVL